MNRLVNQPQSAMEFLLVFENRINDYVAGARDQDLVLNMTYYLMVPETEKVLSFMCCLGSGVGHIDHQLSGPPVGLVPRGYNHPL